LKKKVLIIGYGSIGERHATILSKLRSISQILIFTKRTNIKFKFTKKIEKIISFNPDYIFVCSETAHHFNHIKMIDKNFKNKIVLVEKPLFHKYVKINFKNNKYFVGYNLRFHPVLKFIKEIIKKKKYFQSMSIAVLTFQIGGLKEITKKFIQALKKEEEVCF